jgi:hypothetical protein
MLLHTTTYLTHTSYTIHILYMDVPPNTPEDTPYIRMLHIVHLNYTSYFVCEDVPCNTLAQCILLYTSRHCTQYTCVLHVTLYGRVLYTTNLYYTSCLVSGHFHKMTYSVFHNFLYNTSAWYISLGQGALHSKLLFYIVVHYVSMPQTIRLHDAFYFVNMDATYNTFARYSLLCTSRFSMQYTYIIHPSLFLITSICQECQDHNRMEMRANSVL